MLLKGRNGGDYPNLSSLNILICFRLMFVAAKCCWWDTNNDGFWSFYSGTQIFMAHRHEMLLVKNTNNGHPPNEKDRQVSGLFIRLG